MPGSTLPRTVQFPSTSRYQELVSAWVRFRPLNFSTLPNERVLPKEVGDSGSYILPLQLYNSPNTANYVDTEPSALEQAGMGLRDMFSGGGVGRLSSILTNLPISSLGGLSVSNILDIGGGIGGASMVDVSFSDLNFKGMIKRSHNFNFYLYAKNQKDAESIDDIANGMQVRMYPVLLSRTLNKVQPPAMWQISIVPNGGAANSFVLPNHIQTCVLTNFNARRMGDEGPVLTRDNYYIGIHLTCTFMEIKPAYRSLSKNLESLYSRAAGGYGDIL